MSSISIPQLKLNHQHNCSYTSIGGDKTWKLDGLLHRLDGPALISSNGRKEWWLNGEFFWCVKDKLYPGQSFEYHDTIAVVIKQVNPILFQILVCGNQFDYIFVHPTLFTNSIPVFI